ncbi:hypothetical protein [Bacillus sp. JJ722]|uniref:hypothetical protein n=1 Tax=Bacillus sp. JJ722 TaxID=3122973 RepID=UPI003000EA4F
MLEWLRNTISIDIFVTLFTFISIYSLYLMVQFFRRKRIQFIFFTKGSLVDFDVFRWLDVIVYVGLLIGLVLIGDKLPQSYVDVVRDFDINSRLPLYLLFGLLSLRANVILFEKIIDTWTDWKHKRMEGKGME